MTRIENGSHLRPEAMSGIRLSIRMPRLDALEVDIGETHLFDRRPDIVKRLSNIPKLGLAALTGKAPSQEDQRYWSLVNNDDDCYQIAKDLEDKGEQVKVQDAVYRVSGKKAQGWSIISAPRKIWQELSEFS